MRVKEIKVAKNFTVDELTRFIDTASKFESDIYIVGKNFKVDAKSIIGVISVISAGIEVTLMTRGEDDEEALKVVSNLLI